MIKGLIYIQTSEVPTTIDISGNFINHNFAYLATSAIHIRRDVYYFRYENPWPGNYYYDDNLYQPCGGILINAN